MKISYKTIPMVFMSVFLFQIGFGQSVKRLRDLSAFNSPGDNWQLAKKVQADLEKTGVLIFSGSKGALVNSPHQDKPGTDLLTTEEYGDFDLELEFLLAKGSNSGVYLQGRYEVQLFDSWGVTTPLFSDNGGIYERWDEAIEGDNKGYGGHAPKKNASRAPGKWQQLKISFRAPRFDKEGNKVENATLHYVMLNGEKIHENLVLLGPTRGPISEQESTHGPLRFQGDHGAVAFRNIRVKTYN